MHSIYRNGDEKDPGLQVTIPYEITKSWEHVLELIREKANLTTSAKRLCTLDGEIIDDISKLQQHGSRFVVLEGSSTFQRVEYSITKDTTITSSIE